MNIVFFGSDIFAVKPLEALIQAGYGIACVVTQPDRKKGRGLKIEATPVKEAAARAGLKVYQPVDVNSCETMDFLKGLNPDLFIVIAYGQLLSRDVLSLPKVFSINAHASLLPKYRGAAPINWAIIKGEINTGVTIIKITEKMDAGPIISQKKIPISDEDTATGLQDKLSVLAAEMLLGCLIAIEKKTFKLMLQDESKVTYAPKLKKVDGLIDWSKSAQEIHNLVRGCFDWPGAFTYWQGKILKLHKTMVSQLAGLPVSQLPGTIVEASKDSISVATRKDILAIQELQLEGKRSMAAQDFIAGHKICAGEKLGSKK